MKHLILIFVIVLLAQSSGQLPSTSDADPYYLQKRFYEEAPKSSIPVVPFDPKGAPVDLRMLEESMKNNPGGDFQKMLDEKSIIFLDSIRQNRPLPNEELQGQ